MLLNDAFGCKLFAEHAAGIFAQQLLGVFLVADGGTRSYWGKSVLRQIQFQLQASDQVGNIRALGTIVGMQLIQYQELEHRFSGSQVASPQGGIFLLHQSIVEHFEVGKQDVGNFAMYDAVSVFYDMVFPHLGRVLFGVRAFTDKESGCYLASQRVFFFRSPNGFGKTLCLVASQGVHRIEDDDFHTWANLLPVHLIYVVEYREEETFGLSRTGSCGEQGWFRLMPIVGGQTAESLYLVQVRSERRTDIQGNLLIFLCLYKGSFQGDIRTLEESVSGILNKLVESLSHFIVLEVESGFDIFEYGGAYLVCLLQR